ncbi:hypothetical protein SOP89_09465 [Pseudomonas siliginis]|jgi:hypothetical protein|uniref:Chemotaxis protein n=1 Tax=Pseudomonas mercuritolerans TaxID=2951809 RepID=A0ABT2XZY1_9PSED|nr:MULTISPECIES: hypothetical protein [Pseudomonas]MCV2224254.1 hypothetical protein [Pseudomonas mercuritolerans]MEB2651602.1 hypothetical protein [Pseudomonas siliginis]
MESASASNTSWLGATLAISAFIFGLVGVAALVWQDKTILLAIAAGASFTLAVGLWVITHKQSKRISELEIDLKESRRQAGEWSATSNSISVAIRSMYELAALTPEAPARRVRPRNQDDQNDNE